MKTDDEEEQKRLFGERLRLARKAARITQKTVESRTGLKQGSLSELENGLHKSSGYIAKLAKLYRVNAYWLATGIGDQFGIEDPSLAAKLTNLHIDNIDYLHNNREPVVMDWPEIINRITVNERMQSNEVFKFLYEGQLMSGPDEPIIPSGSILKVDTAQPLRIGKPAVANLNGKQIIGAYHEVGDSIYLCPSNRQFDAIEVARDQILGPVVSSERIY